MLGAVLILLVAGVAAGAFAAGAVGQTVTEPAAGLANRRADADAHADPDAVAHPDAHADTHAHPDADADAGAVPVGADRADDQ